MATQDLNTKLPKIDQLVLEISQGVTQLKSAISASIDDRPGLSPEEVRLSNASDDIDDHRTSLIDSLDKLRDLLLTPRELLLQGLSSANFLALHALQRFNIAKNIPIGETRSYSELALACGLPVKTCKRFVRQAYLMRVLCEPQSGMVGHTSASELMVQNPHVHDYMGTVCEEVWPAAVKTMDAISKWPDSTDPRHSGYTLANGMPIYELLPQDKRRSDQYASSMEAFAGDNTYAFDLVLGDYDWAGLGDATVVDVGGSLGSVSRLLATHFPKLRFNVEDLPEVITEAEREDIPKEIKDRVQFLRHDMFKEQPVKQADVYYFRSVMFDWPNDKVVEILTAHKPALKTGSIILIQDSFVPEPGVVPRFLERRLRSTNLLGLALRNHSVRDLQEWQDIFEKSGPGFEFVRAEFLKRSGKAMIEARWTGMIS